MEAVDHTQGVMLVWRARRRRWRPKVPISGDQHVTSVKVQLRRDTRSQASHSACQTNVDKWDNAHFPVRESAGQFNRPATAPGGQSTQSAQPATDNTLWRPRDLEPPPSGYQRLTQSQQFSRSL